MRTEQEMFDLIIGTAQRDERIRAVYMNGSRTNKNVKTDIFQDYDIVYVVRETKPFYEDGGWLDVFGERLLMQCPDAVDQSLGLAVDFDRCYGWLILFKDGNRLDLHVVPVDAADVRSDKLCVILLDKDGILPKIPEATDADYRVKKPGQNEFLACCNEFWWCMNNIAKGLWREEVPYVHEMYESAVHPQLLRLLNWKVGYETGFAISTGKASKYLKDYLPETLWNRFLGTYMNGNIDDMWQSALAACELFHDTALELEQKWGHDYNKKEAEAGYGFLKHVKTLPKDAAAVY